MANDLVLTAAAFVATGCAFERIRAVHFQYGRSIQSSGPNRSGMVERAPDVRKFCGNVTRGGAALYVYAGLR